VPARHRTLADPGSRQIVLKRIAALPPDAPRRWGKMTAHQALCHLTDSYKGVIGERAVSPTHLWIPQPILKWLVLHAAWPKGAPTRPEVDQLVGGTAPGDFAADRKALIEAMDRFCSAPDSRRGAHPLIGRMSREDWMRWGYLHADHHLRQFGH